MKQKPFSIRYSFNQVLASCSNASPPSQGIKVPLLSSWDSSVLHLSLSQGTSRSIHSSAFSHSSTQQLQTAVTSLYSTPLGFQIRSAAPAPCYWDCPHRMNHCRAPSPTLCLCTLPYCCVSTVNSSSWQRPVAACLLQLPRLLQMTGR